MNKFKVGDRYVYYCCSPFNHQEIMIHKGTIIEVINDRCKLKDALDGDEMWVHYTNIRRLKPPTPLMRLWISKIDPYHFTYEDPKCPDGWREYVELRTKKC